MQGNAPSKDARIVLVRHAESTWNELHLVQGQRDDARLTPRGLEQAALVACELPTTFDAIVSSDLQRAAETAQVLAAALGLTVTIDVSLRERDYGIAEGEPSSMLTPALTGIADDVVVDELACPQGGESLLALYERSARFVDSIRDTASDHRLLVVTHGGTIRAYCEGRTMAGLAWDAVANCSVWPVALPARV